jgi:hypothetical protein
MANEEHRFTKSVRDFAPGQLWLVRQRVAQHREEHQGKPPQCLVMHTHTLRRVFEEWAVEQGLDIAAVVPSMDRINRGMFEGVPVFHCRCGFWLASDDMITCEGKHEEI